MKRPDSVLASDDWRLFSPRSLGLFGLAFAVRLIHLLQIRPAPFFRLKMGDALSYHEWAARLAAGDWVGGDIFYQAPLYPYFLGVVYAVLGDGSMTARLVQITVGALSCVLLAGAGARFFSPRTGLIAGLMLAFYPGALFFDALFQKSVLDVFVFSILLWVLGGLAREPRRDLALWAGVALGFLVLVRENALAFLVAILLWLMAHYRDRGSERLALAGLFAGGLALVLLPIAARNLAVGGEFHLTTAQFGTAFYMGNNPEADGLHRPLVPYRGNPMYERRDATELAEQAMGRELTPREVSDYWKTLALDWIRGHPGDWLVLMLRKFALFWNAVEIVDNEDSYTHADWSLPLRLTSWTFHFGVLAPLAVLGVWVSWPQRDRLWLLYLLIAIYTASVLVFFVFARYRHALIPLLILFAAAGLDGIVRFVRQAPRESVAGALLTAFAVAVFCNWPVSMIHAETNVDSMRAGTEFNVGAALQFEGRHQEAIPHFVAALELRPTHMLARYGLANALFGLERYAEAAREYQQVLRLRPEFIRAQYGLGLSLAGAGDVDGAIAQYGETLRIDPNHAEAHTNLANLLQARGELALAIQHYVHALRIDASSSTAHFNMAVALGRQGREDEAIDHLEEVLRLEPSHAMARGLLERIRAESGAR